MASDGTTITATSPTGHWQYQGAAGRTTFRVDDDAVIVTEQLPVGGGRVLIASSVIHEDTTLTLLG